MEAGGTGSLKRFAMELIAVNDVPRGMGIKRRMKGFDGRMRTVAPEEEEAKIEIICLRGDALATMIAVQTAEMRASSPWWLACQNKLPVRDIHFCT